MIPRRFQCACWVLTSSILIGLPSVWSAEKKATLADDANSQGTQTPDGMSVAEQREYFELLRLFVDTFDQIERNYDKPISRRELMEAAIQGMLSKLDEHSDYIAPDDVEDFRRDVTSQFGGIGIHIGLDDRNRLTVISPLVGTPAYRAGLMAGDRIISINGSPVRGMKRKLEEAVKLLKGPAGTDVKLTVVHDDRPEPKTVTLTREVIRIETVLGSRRKSDDTWQFMHDEENRIGYIRVTVFSNRTADDVHQVLVDLQSQGMRALVVDLRFNPGGLFASAIAIADMFLSEGLIVTTDGRNVRQESWNATADGSFEGFPMAVLINRYSASGSEIVAASLQDNNRAVVIGERSYGKGSVQQVVDLDEGRSTLKLTTGSYRRPNGKNIHRFPNASEDDDWGVRPNEGFEIRRSSAEQRALFRQDQQRRLLRGNRPSTETDVEDGEADNDSEFTDRQLQRAIQYLREQLSNSETENTLGAQSKSK